MSLGSHEAIEAPLTPAEQIEKIDEMQANLITSIEAFGPSRRSSKQSEEVAKLPLTKIKKCKWKRRIMNKTINRITDRPPGSDHGNFLDELSI